MGPVRVRRANPGTSDDTVTSVVRAGECASCGICAGVCPAGAVTLALERGIPTPQISAACVHCGLCLAVCPGHSMLEETLYGGRFSDSPRGASADADASEVRSDDMADASGERSEEIRLFRAQCAGQVLSAALCRSAEEPLRRGATSGGVITALILLLLQRGLYDSAFVVCTHAFGEIAGTVRVSAGADLSQKLPDSQKSRYVSISHGEAVRYLLAHRKERVILTGTPCAVRGLLNVIECCHLDRKQYLLIGLFCDKTMTYRVWDYFSTFTGRGRVLTGLHFRDKTSGGWPGGVKLIMEGHGGQRARSGRPGTDRKDDSVGSEDSFLLLPKRARERVKDFYLHPRCLYCTDKLNVDADLSFGDNYTGRVPEGWDPAEGSSCVLVRTERGMRAWQNLKQGSGTEGYGLEWAAARPEEIFKSQQTGGKFENLQFARLRYGRRRNGNDGVSSAEGRPGKKISGNLPLKVRIKYYYKRLKLLTGGICRGRRSLAPFLWLDRLGRN